MNELRLIAELDQEILVTRIACSKKRRCRIASSGKLVGHTPGGVKHESDAQRQVLERKVLNPLFNLVFPEPKVLAFQSGNEPAFQIGYGCVDQNDGDIDFQRLVLHRGTHRRSHQ